MSLDSRFPNLFHVKDAPGLTPELKDRAIAFVAAVIHRVPGVKGCYNAKQGELFFYFIDPAGGPLAIPITGEDGWPLDQRDIDDSVSILMLALEPLRKREEKRAAKEAQEKRDHEQLKEKKKAERRPSLQHHADFLRRKRRGLQKTSVYVQLPSGLVVPHENGVLK